MGAANLSRQSVDAFQQYMAVALMFGVQAVDLRSKIVAGHFYTRRCLSPATEKLYSAVRETVGRPPSEHRPYIWSDHIQSIANDIAHSGRIPDAVREIRFNT